MSFYKNEDVSVCPCIESKQCTEYSYRLNELRYQVQITSKLKQIGSGYQLVQITRTVPTFMSGVQVSQVQIQITSRVRSCSH